MVLSQCCFYQLDEPIRHCTRLCGFSSTLEGNTLSYDQQVVKLRLIVKTSEEVWG